MQYIKEKGFTLVEVFMMLFIVSLALAATVSMITKMKHKNIGTESNVISCIESDAAGINFDTTTGNITSLPASGSCYAAYYGCSKGRMDICNTLFSYADGRGSANQTIASLKILRASCDNGGTDACSYFNTRCYGNQTNCYSPDQNFTLRYYLNLSSATANMGRAYVETTGIDYYKWNMSTYNGEIDTVCPTCLASSTACIIKNCSSESGSGSWSDGILIDGGTLCVAPSDLTGNYTQTDALIQCSTNGWRLPTIGELSLMYNNTAFLGTTIPSTGYWGGGSMCMVGKFFSGYLSGPSFSYGCSGTGVLRPVRCVKDP